MFVYNTLSGKKTLLLPRKKKTLKLFVCGPTVYDLSHIGHARTYIFFDFFARYLRARGFKVFYLQNITDIDDRVIARARTLKKKPETLAANFTKEYLKDMASLGIESVNVYAPATKFISQIISQIERLIKKGYAYKLENDLPTGQAGGWYYDIKKFKDYGRLSNRTVAQAEDAVSRIDENKNKRNKGDFALWKFVKSRINANTSTNEREYEMKIINGEPAWNTPLGWGRPGWHIEDTAISEHYFGPQYDIHGSAVDLKFPHHEAEIAQQEGASGPPANEFARRRSRAGKKPMVKIWMHAGFLLIDGKKMSKSLNNFITIKDLLKKYEPGVLRLMILSHHYRSPLNFSAKLAEQTKTSFSGLAEFMSKLDFVGKARNGKGRNLRMEKIIKENEKAFHKALENDLNTPLALARVFALASEFQNKIWNLGDAEAKILKNHLEKMLKMLGLEIKTPKIPKKIRALALKRELLRVNKQFVQADALRKKIWGLGYKVDDTPRGQFVTLK